MLQSAGTLIDHGGTRSAGALSRHCSRRALLSLISVLVGLALLEFAIRLTPFGRPKLDLTPFFEYDAHLGWRNRPFAKGTIYDWEYVTHLQYNSKGMRGP